jgi:serine/threonine protein kinase/Flp pilus assembly protein TadD
MVRGNLMTQPLPSARDLPRYGLLARIGTCGATESFLAVIPAEGASGKRVLVERVWPQLERDPHFVAVFLEEARLSLRLRHPALVQAYEIGWQDNGYYLASEYVDGQSLEDLLAGSALLELPLSVEILLSVLGALEYGHNLTERGTPLNIVHRRVRPSNVFIAQDGSVKLGRFGVAQTVAAERRIEAGVPEPPLCDVAPEQFRGEPIDRRADLYSVGVMLWEMVARRRLWAGVSDASLAQWLREGRTAPALRGADIPPELASVAARALAMDPRDRYATASEFQADLAQILTVSPVSRAQQLGALANQASDRTHAHRSSGRTPTPAGRPPNGTESRVIGGKPRRTLLQWGPAPAVPPVPPAVIESARHTPMALSAVDDDAATRVRLPRKPSRPTAWWLGSAAVLLAVAAIALAGGRQLSPPLAAPDPRPSSAASIERPVVEPLQNVRRAGTAPPPASLADRSSKGRGRSRSRLAAVAVRSARRRVPAADRLARNAAAREAAQALALGEQALASGELRFAEQELEHALQLDPTNGEVLATLAEVRFERARYKEALPLVERAVRTAPDNPKYLVLLGDVCLKVGLEADAAAAYARARVVRPDDAEIRERFDNVAGPPLDPRR